MRHHFVAFLLLCVCLPAQAVYRCEQNGAVSYADHPCAGGRSTDISEDVRDLVSQGDAAAARKRLQQEKRAAADIETEKLRDLKRQNTAREVSARQSAAKEKVCRPLALRMKWAEEDLATASGKSVDSARRKAKRAAERYDLHCKETRPLGLL